MCAFLRAHPRPFSLAPIPSNAEIYIFQFSKGQFEGKAPTCNPPLTHFFRTLPDEERREEASRIVLKYLLDDAADLVGSVDDHLRERLTKTLLGTLSWPFFVTLLLISLSLRYEGHSSPRLLRQGARASIHHNRPRHPHTLVGRP